jgi:hypothetical protein
MTSNLFYNTGIQPEKILDQLYLESQVEKNYYWSPAVPPVFRCDVSPFLKSFFTKFINVPISDAGFLKNFPKSQYPTHKDTFRIVALNMLMVEPNENFITSVYEINLREKKFNQHVVNYVKNQFTILNVSEPHSVMNKTTNSHRIMLSIGIKTHTYTELMDLHSKNKLFNTDIS